MFRKQVSRNPRARRVVKRVSEVDSVVSELLSTSTSKCTASVNNISSEVRAPSSASTVQSSRAMPPWILDGPSNLSTTSLSSCRHNIFLKPGTVANVRSGEVFRPCSNTSLQNQYPQQCQQQNQLQQHQNTYESHQNQNLYQIQQHYQNNNQHDNQQQLSIVRRTPTTISLSRRVSSPFRLSPMMTSSCSSSSLSLDLPFPSPIASLPSNRAPSQVCSYPRNGKYDLFKNALAELDATESLFKAWASAAPQRKPISQLVQNNQQTYSNQEESQKEKIQNEREQNPVQQALKPAAEDSYIRSSLSIRPSISTVTTVPSVSHLPGCLEVQFYPPPSSTMAPVMKRMSSCTSQTCFVPSPTLVPEPSFPYSDPLSPCRPGSAIQPAQIDTNVVIQESCEPPPLRTGILPSPCLLPLPILDFPSAVASPMRSATSQCALPITETGMPSVKRIMSIEMHADDNQIIEGGQDGISLQSTLNSESGAPVCHFSSLSFSPIDSAMETADARLRSIMHLLRTPPSSNTHLHTSKNITNDSPGDIEDDPTTCQSSNPKSDFKSIHHTTRRVILPQIAPPSAHLNDWQHHGVSPVSVPHSSAVSSPFNRFVAQPSSCYEIKATPLSLTPETSLSASAEALLSKIRGLLAANKEGGGTGIEKETIVALFDKLSCTPAVQSPIRKNYSDGLLKNRLCGIDFDNLVSPATPKNPNSSFHSSLKPPPHSTFKCRDTDCQSERNYNQNKFENFNHEERLETPSFVAPPPIEISRYDGFTGCSQEIFDNWHIDDNDNHNNNS